MAGTSTSDPAIPRRSPALLALVFGVFLVIIGVTATGQSILVSSHVTTQSLDALVAADASLLRILVNGTIVPADLDPATLTTDRSAALQAELAIIVGRGGMLRIDVRTPAGVLLFASDSRYCGSRNSGYVGVSTW